MEIKGKRGGARPGAGRPRKNPGQTIRPPAFQFGERVPPPPRPGVPPPAPDLPLIPEEMEPMEFLEAVMRGRIDATSAQISAAKGLMAYKHKKPAEESKKEAAVKKAQAAASRFGPRPPPGVPTQ